MSTANEQYAKTFIGVHAFFLNEKGETLILQRAKTNSYKPLKWDIPGGKMQSGEDVETALKREVFEETGLKIISAGKPLSVYVNREQLPAREDVQIVFECIIENTDESVQIHLSEHCGYKWITPEQLSSVDCMEYLKHFYNSVYKKDL